MSMDKVCVGYKVPIQFTIKVVTNSGLLYTTGYSVARCMSNQETTEVVTLLFQAMKQQSNDTQIRVLMTDDGKLKQSYWQTCS